MLDLCTNANVTSTSLSYTGQQWLHATHYNHLISSAEKLTIVGMKFSRIMMERICFQSVVLSPSSRQMDSKASLTAAGGLAMDLTSTKCCFLMDLTAKNQPGKKGEYWSNRVQKNKDGVKRGRPETLA